MSFLKRTLQTDIQVQFYKIRTNHFYDKNQFARVGADKLDMIEGYTREQIDAYIWYLKTRGQ